MAKFHITITDNETGEAIRDHDINGIIAGIDLDDNVSACVICCGTPFGPCAYSLRSKRRH